MTGERYCHTVTPFRPDVKLIAAQTLPWWGLQLSGTYQGTPGPARQANWTISQAVANQNGWTITTAPGPRGLRLPRRQGFQPDANRAAGTRIR